MLWNKQKLNSPLWASMKCIHFLSDLALLKTLDFNVIFCLGEIMELMNDSLEIFCLSSLP